MRTDAPRSGPHGSKVDFWFDVVCPYAYVAASRVAWLERVTGVQVRWNPVLLGGVLRAVGSPDVPMTTWSEVKAKYTVSDVVRSAASANLTVSYPSSHPRRTVEAMRLLTAAGPDSVPALAMALWAAYWTDHRDLTDPVVLADLARAHGVDPERIHDEEVKDALRERTALAVDTGVFGVPSFTIGDRLYWGADRMRTVATDLGATLGPALPTGPIEVFHDFSSPYSYLGVLALLNADPSIEVVLTPILLGALFREIGTPGVPMATFPPAKRRYVGADLASQARYRGLPLRFTEHFPLRTVTALRVAILEPRATRCLYHAAWVDNQDLGVPEVVERVLTDAGYPGVALVAETREPQVKQRLRENTERAVSLGVPGAPAFSTGGELYWGQDQLELAAASQGHPVFGG